MNIAKYVAVILLILLLLGIAIKQQVDLNAAKDEVARLQAEYDKLAYENDKKESELALPEDERLAAEAKKNGYRDPGAQYYYNTGASN